MMALLSTDCGPKIAKEKSVDDSSELYRDARRKLLPSKNFFSWEQNGSFDLKNSVFEEKEKMRPARKNTFGLTQNFIVKRAEPLQTRKGRKYLIWKLKVSKEKACSRGGLTTGDELLERKRLDDAGLN